MALLAVVGLITGGCAPKQETPAETNQQNEAENNNNDVSNLNWRVPDFTFTNQEGKAIGTDDLKGKVWLADFIFTRCPNVCPPMTANMVQVQKHLKQKGVDITYVSFSVDPEYDQPKELKVFAEKHGADLTQWHFLTGYKLEEIQKIAKDAFKGAIDQQKGPSEDVPILINHPTQFYLIDQTGKVRKFYSGLEPNTKELADRIAKDVKEIQK